MYQSTKQTIYTHPQTIANKILPTTIKIKTPIDPNYQRCSIVTLYVMKIFCTSKFAFNLFNIKHTM